MISLKSGTITYGEWPAKFSNVFDDHLFDGQEYTFTVESRKRNGDNPHVILELQTISQDLYYFLKSYLVFRISTDDVYMTPIGLYSNIKMDGASRAHSATTAISFITDKRIHKII